MQDKKRISQAFVKFTAALKNFERTMKLPEDNEDYRNSAILSFLLTQETAWKAIKWLLKEEIAIEANGPKTVIQEAFLQGWLGTDSDIWFDMTQDRNLIAHTYNG
ncbi:MAG: HI0074 family nucleotidyltransferase substrate-binding subunit, partial [Pseudomonadota bacterium]